MRRRLIFIAPAALLGIALFSFIGGEVVRLLWNWLLPPLFGWHELNFWQAIGILALCRILFGGLGMNNCGRCNSRQRKAGRLEQLTPEEREQLRQGAAGRGHRGDGFFDPPAGESREQ